MIECCHQWVSTDLVMGVFGRKANSFPDVRIRSNSAHSTHHCTLETVAARLGTAARYMFIYLYMELSLALRHAEQACRLHFCLNRNVYHAHTQPQHAHW